MAVRDEIERLIGQLPRFRHGFDESDFSSSGVYFFHEDTEPQQRIVRVGFHDKEGRLTERLNQHFGAARSLGGSRRASVFRMHLGGALLNGNPRQALWLDLRSGSMPDIEAEVSRTLRDHFEFSTLSVPDRSERLALAKLLIGNLASEPSMSDRWLGLKAADPVTRQCGLWNVKNVDAACSVDLDRLRQLVQATLAGGNDGD